MKDLERMRIIAAHYCSLQGLRMLPWFLWLLLISAVNPILGLPQGQLDYQCLLVIPGIAVPWVLSKWIGAYYDRAYGRVESLPPHNRPVEVLANILFIVIAYIGFAIDTSKWLPISVAGLIMAAAFMVGWWKADRLPVHMLVLAVVLVVLSLLPLAGIPADGHWSDLWGGFVDSIVLVIII
ncbi:MAG: hypothetical protein JXR84_18980, partial [Anaerolineae bacterium]|nr:hypothetical protein [Anaerolineae bacterium]